MTKKNEAQTTGGWYVAGVNDPRNTERTCSKNTHHANLSLEGPTHLPPNITNTIDSSCIVHHTLTDVEAAVNLRWDGADLRA
jgi:hypothetical protein